jgi:hypothetical protein
VTAIDSLRSAERAFWGTGDMSHLDRAESLLSGELRGEWYAPATRAWLLLLRYDLGGDDQCLDAAGTRSSGKRKDPAVAEVTVAVLLRRWARDGDPADLDRAIRLAENGGADGPVARDTRDRPLWLTHARRAADLGGAYLERARQHDADDDLHAARAVLRDAVRAAARDPAIRVHGMRYLAATEQELYLRHGSRHLLGQAIRHYERALAMAGEQSVIRPMLLTELSTAVQDRFAADEAPGDLDRAVNLAEQAVTHASAAGASRPDLACHLVNLGTALNMRYQERGNSHDLDDALRRWVGALDALPTASAYRPAFLERLALGLLMRWEHEGGGEEDLSAAIGYGRAAVREAAGGRNIAIYSSHLADALGQRWGLHRDPADLHEAVRVHATAMNERADDGTQSADLACNYAHTLLTRYQALGGREDLDAAVTVLSRILPNGLGKPQRTTVAALTARVLSMRYEAAGDQEDLAAAIAAARRGLVGVDAAAMVRASRTARLAGLLSMRYAKHGRRRDLDEAIRLLQAGAGPGSNLELPPDQLSQLACYLADRYDRDGDEADRDAAIRLGRQAQASDRRDGEPSLDANLAAALHDRFDSEGRLDDLDETVARYREALARQAPGAPTYSAILSNLGIALQDCFIYRDGDSLLDESITLHERAAADCPPTSPSHAGYLSTLAAAIQLRFERDHQAADINRAIDLYGQALAELSPGAPERAEVLGSLAAVRHLYARSTADPADFDAAIGTHRAALRRIRRSSPMRPLALAGYAQALADAPSESGSDPRRPGVVSGRRRAGQVERVFREAVTASQGAPLVRLDVASSFGEWALRNGLWPQAAEAYYAAAEARRTLFGTQLDRAHRDTWLARSEEISASEAYARAQSGHPDLAAAALDAGRALALAEALDVRTLADRLRAGSYHALAARYQEAMGVLVGVVTVRS